MSENNVKTNEQPAKKCFVIMPISDVEGYDKGHFDRVYNYIVVPVCRQAGYEAFRADGTSKTNVIIIDILRNVVNCDMAICDLSARNPNVFYELGFRQAFNKKTVLMKDERTDRPFDISSIRSLNYDSSLRIDLVDKAIKELSKALLETHSMTEDEPNSLLKLLSIDNPAKLPKKHELSDDSTIILQAIHDLSDDMQRNLRKRRMIPYRSDVLPQRYILPNADVAKVGDHLYDKDLEKELGEIIEIIDGGIVMKNPDGEIGFFTDESFVGHNVVVMPF